MTSLLQDDWISLLLTLKRTGLEIVSADRESGQITLKVPSSPH